MHYAEYPPPPALAGLVRCFWHLGDDGGRGAERGGDEADPALPDGSPELILNFGDPFEHLVVGRRPRRQPAAFLVGQITAPMHVRPTGAIHLVAARLEAHGAAMLHRPMHALTDTWCTSARLPGGLADLVHGPGASPTVEGQVAALADWLVRVRGSARAADERVARAVGTIRASQGAASADGLARDAGLTPRSLQRLFAEEVGISPKMLARIVRFQRVFTALREQPGSWARVAIASGYYDQSHLVRDFRDFAGDAPARLLAALPEFTAHFLPGPATALHRR